MPAGSFVQHNVRADDSALVVIKQAGSLPFIEDSWELPDDYFLSH